MFHDYNHNAEKMVYHKIDGEIPDKAIIQNFLEESEKLIGVKQ